MRSGWLRVFLFLIACLVVGLVSSGVALLIWFALQGSADTIGQLLQSGGNGAGQRSQEIGPFVAVQSAAMLALLFCIVFFRRIVDRRSLVSLGLSLRKQSRAILTGLVLGAALITAGVGSLSLFGGFSLARLELIFWPIVGYGTVFFFAAFLEEFLVRGYILTNLMEATNSYVALLLSSGVFALFHLLNPHMAAMPLLNLVLAGVLLGIYPMHRRNLWFSVSLHWSWNFFQGPIWGLGVSGLSIPSLVVSEVRGPAWLTGGSFGLEGSLIATVLTGVAAIFIDWHFRKSVDISFPNREL